jgi:hypothetical protein
VSTPAAIAQQDAEQAPEIERVNAAGQALVAAISARDIGAMEKLWARDARVTFIGPLSTSIVAGRPHITRLGNRRRRRMT